MKSFMKQHPVASFFVLAYAISWALWVPAVLVWKLSDQMPWWGMPAYLVGTYAPSFAALAMTGILEGKPGVKKLLARFLVWRVGFRWYLVVFLATPILILAAMGIYIIQGGALGRFDPGQWYAVLLAPVFALPFFVGEELGWRGYALPRLQRKYSALLSSIILGVLWALWHAPAYWAPVGTPISGGPVTLLAVGWYLIFTTGLAILHTWVYNNTKESVLLAVLFHAMYTGDSLWPLFPDISLNALNQTVRLVIIPIWVLAVLVIVLFGAARLSRQPVSQEPGEV